MIYVTIQFGGERGRGRGEEEDGEEEEEGEKGEGEELVVGSIGGRTEGITALIDYQSFRFCRPFYSKLPEQDIGRFTVYYN